MKRTCFLAMIVLAGLAASSRADSIMAHLFDYRAGGPGMDRLAVAPGPNYVLVAAPSAREIHLLRPDWDSSRFEKIDAFPPTDPTAAIPVPGRAVAVAVHPFHPLAIALSRPNDAASRGEALFLDLRERSPGRLLRSQLVGFAPAHVAITPDGAWAIVANSGADNRRTEGSVGVFDLRNLEGWEQNRLQEIPYRELSGLASMLGQSLSRHEPEFVAVDPLGRLAAVSVPTADTIVWMNFDKSGPQWAGILRLPKGSGPTGMALVNLPDNSLLLGVAEQKAQMVSFYRVTLAGGIPAAERAARVDIRPLVRENRPRKDRDPHTLALLRSGSRVWAWVACARTDRIVMLDVTDPSKPALLDRLLVSAPPNDLVVFQTPAGLRLLTANSDGNVTLAGVVGGADN
ncbi:MAG: DUF1513 domain-containing protein [Kiritimatiellae bacterium]|nr:DUF1513 domain-containing protein [Kiritimatiellia bacterium]MDW8458263.1 hypothetical protein [Verrucomicrobiota bacterium]